MILSREQEDPETIGRFAIARLAGQAEILAASRLNGRLAILKRFFAREGRLGLVQIGFHHHRAKKRFPGLPQWQKKESLFIKRAIRADGEYGLLMAEVFEGHIPRRLLIQLAEFFDRELNLWPGDRLRALPLFPPSEILESLSRSRDLSVLEAKRENQRTIVFGLADRQNRSARAATTNLAYGLKDRLWRAIGKGSGLLGAAIIAGAPLTARAFEEQETVGFGVYEASLSEIYEQVGLLSDLSVEVLSARAAKAALDRSLMTNSIARIRKKMLFGFDQKEEPDRTRELADVGDYLAVKLLTG